MRVTGVFLTAEMFPHGFGWCDRKKDVWKKWKWKVPLDFPFFFARDQKRQDTPAELGALRVVPGARGAHKWSDQVSA